MRLTKLMICAVLSLGALPARARGGVIQLNDVTHTYDPKDAGATVTVHVQDTTTSSAGGNPDHWRVSGGAGSFFDGFDGFPLDQVTITFNKPIKDIALQVSRSNASLVGDAFKLEAFLGNKRVAQEQIDLGAFGQWTNVKIAAAAFDRIVWDGAGPAFHPYAVRNVTFDLAPASATGVGQSTPVPEPTAVGSMLLIGAGLLARRRK